MVAAMKSTSLYYAAHLDGDIDVADETHLDACAADSPTDGMSLFVHGPVFPDLLLIHSNRVKGPLVMVDLTYKGQIGSG